MKSRVVLVADPDKVWRDAKLCRFVRDAEENPVLTFTKWTRNNKAGGSRWLAIQGHQVCEVQRMDDNRSLFAPRNVVVQDIMETCGVPLHGISRWTVTAIAKLCDIDGDDIDSLHIRRNDDKITAWLRAKVDRIQAVAMLPTNGTAEVDGTSFQRPPDEAASTQQQQQSHTLSAHVGKDAEFRYFLFDQCCIRRLRLTSSSDSMQKAAALSILCHALLDKKMEYCRVHTVLAAKQLLHAKAVVDECAERLVVLDELLRDLYDNEHDVSEEIGAMLDEQAQEEATHQALTAAVRAHRALLQRLVHKKTRLETCRKGILHRQRRLVERAFRMQVAENSAELLAQSI
ncbi:hypothetical protein DYB25_002345 [Aphanomyces astaci]|uniref:Uncharacterized protein n=1 Tax=Aphanomyces astaci TaxID=112090 RepID=A0A397DSN3_APHAT|nr:hypothetical protein DYB25_002345 [Aphanomyces astaci]RHY50540.1 hypothetical protein DYB34_004573 [Aphanomyces astaci]RHY69256.1 hypothetical protein DYB38_003674 [Aphanomyces astaci]RHY70398.1 hypothetical protein DYB30_006998 [Aphanomyces astaci]RHZ28524.1 hypothetical protein DYB31_003983 [Aphanomyces astaci]